MASLEKRLAANADGDFYVDSTCIDCGTCRWVAAASFQAAGEQSRVFLQPSTAEEIRRAEMALLACPTGSIGTLTRHDLAAARAAFPDHIDGPVYHCGYHAEESFGAASYLIRRPQGNVLVDSPRFTTPLVRRLEAMGGVRTMVLTHRDDVADHHRFHRHFGCERVLHADDVTAGTAGVERQIPGREPVRLAADMLFIPVPGHTRGSACLLVGDRYLFSGDHVAWSARFNVINAFRDACWYDWDELVRSMARLARCRFEWILPGHGQRCHFPPERMQAEMRRCLEWLRQPLR